MTKFHTLETPMKQAIVKDFKDRGHYARRIEDAYSVGFPDLVLIPKEYPVFFCEAKIIRDNLFSPTPRQYVELGRMAITRYAVPCILGYKDGVHYLHQYAEQVHYKDCVAQEEWESMPHFFQRFYHERIEK